ncbi:MAG: hypothetical protein V3U00_05705 [Gammaproteobacteria bacterium]
MTALKFGARFLTITSFDQSGGAALPMTLDQGAVPRPPLERAHGAVVCWARAGLAKGVVRSDVRQGQPGERMPIALGTGMYREH